ncbi:MAG: DUF433 domain-containing protein [Planctomycetota bacterium]|nr:DUF433 domain-containing protein [Planctomycetota bacterium]MDP7250446.1 DUF433 domain-containing protein [Planctomycetota bacterium]
MEQRPDVCGGKLCVQGTRITVLQIAALERRGNSPEEITAAYEHWELAEVHAALAHYHANRDELDSELAREKNKDEELKQEYGS